MANELRVKRIGSQHQAGSDSLLTGEVFFTMYKEYFSDGLDDMKYNGFICGLGGSTMGLNSTATPSKFRGDLIDDSVCSDMEELHSSLASPMRDH